MKKILSCEFNPDTACVELCMEDGTLLSIDCTAVENEVANSMYQRSELDWLIYNDPLSYAELILNGDPELYLKAVTKKTPLDCTSSMVTGMPPEKPDRDASMMSMKTMPDAPSSAVRGNNAHCRMPEMRAVSRMPLSRGRLPYFSSIGGPTTRRSSILFRKWSQLPWPSTWPKSRM